MRNVPIAGGQPVGKPRSWDEATQGECMTISVRLKRDHASGPVTGIATAWRFDAEELAALQAGGAFILEQAIPFVPVMQLYTETAGGDLVGELQSDTDRDNAIMTALRSIAVALGMRLPQELPPIAGKSMAELFQLIMRQVESVPNQVCEDADANDAAAAFHGVKMLPVLTLRDLRDGQMAKYAREEGERLAEAMLHGRGNGRRLGLLDEPFLVKPDHKPSLLWSGYDPGSPKGDMHFQPRADDAKPEEDA